eukprot:gnl/TRDRNA2_/TRDRNA2_178852_c0_seq1.p1 gnl/TRDRNA2_/TRDRNA2_178852_c0~~gnl/TRDRNA2_/TRDRNA2_178852_c0_seq1.p1  ORF type:complete len:265 (-),score=62.34 gnl/TRDRNA2_/TRDRNA2_178852_c0_seq1:66-860(-)
MVFSVTVLTLLAAAQALPVIDEPGLRKVPTAHLDETLLHPPIATLNRVTFEGNVLQPTGAKTEHWIINFCAHWYEPCQALAPHFSDLGAQWEKSLDKGALFTAGVRFAQVDCAVDKVLCNEMGVEDYPTVMHYHQQEKLASWTAQGWTGEAMAQDAPRLARWLRQQIGREGEEARAAAKAAKLKKLGERLPKQNMIVLFIGLFLIGLFAIVNFVNILRGAGILGQPNDAPKPAVRVPATVKQEESEVDSIFPEQWSKDRKTIEL